MPYIQSDDGRREALQRGEPALTAGELNYQIFYYMKHHLNSEIKKEEMQKFVNQFLGEKPNYQRYNDMTGALIRCAKEIQRRGLNDGVYIQEKDVSILLKIMRNYDNEIAKYEDLKCLQNGDVE